MLARRFFLCASLLAATILPGTAQTPAPAPAEMAKPKSAPAPAAAPAPIPTDRAGLRRYCAERSEAMGLRGKTKLRWQVKCRKGKLAN